MANDVVIRAEGLGKKYVIGHQSAERVPTLRDAISRTAANFARTSRDLLRGKPLIAGDQVEEFWALRDASFEVRRGDVVGIIGRNGAGKSTLLKILSRITEPSEGRVEIRGRVASLLEVGTGFHPELSGRENVFLNGAILGMSHAEIRRKFDEIVAFAEIEKFLDTPVKRYSSGMYVRLAFAVAAHLEPEILIVDEVLAVGDAEFQKKCLGKMHDVAGEGRTVLFVSHNMAAIRSLCAHGLLMESGRLAADGTMSEISTIYEGREDQAGPYEGRGLDSGVPQIERAAIDFLGDHLLLELAISSPASDQVIINLLLRDSFGGTVGMASLGGFDPGQLVSLQSGKQEFMFEIGLPKLAVGTYRLDLDIERPYHHFLQRISDALAFKVTRTPTSRHGRVLELSWNMGAIELQAVNRGFL